MTNSNLIVWSGIGIQPVMTVCFKNNPLVECRRRTLAPGASAGVETKSTTITKDLLESCGLDTSRESHAGLLDHQNLLEI